MAQGAWNLSCVDWEQRLRDGRSLVPELPLFAEPAKKALQIFDQLRLPDVPGLPTLGEAAGDWFRDIVRALMGSLSPSGHRFIEEVLALVAKKNSKTSYGAGLMLTALLMNERPRAEFLIVAPTQAISELAFSQAVGMIEADPALMQRFRIKQHLKEALYLPNKSRLKIKTFDANILTGPKPVGVLLDELHLLGKNAHAAKVLLQLRGGRVANPEGFLVILTTQSDEPPAGAFRTELLRARKIRDGEIGGTMLPVLYEFPRDVAVGDEELWRQPKYWRMVTPNIGRSVSLDTLQTGYESALTEGDAGLRLWASQHLNLEIGISLHTDRWAGTDYWKKQGDVRLTKLDWLLAHSELVVVGLDGGGLDDLFGVAVLGRDKRDRRKWYLWSHAYAFKSVLERRKSDVTPKLETYAAAGEVTLIDRLGDDIDAIVDMIADIDERGLLATVAVDPFGINDVVEALRARGIHNDGAGPDRVVGVSQGWRLQGAIKTTERALAEGALLHGDLQLMAWCVGNAKVEPRGNAITITKQAAGTAKIDPLMALFNAVSIMSEGPELPPPPPASPYDQDETFAVEVA